MQHGVATIKSSEIKILQTRPNVDATDIDGHTALSRAAWQGHVEIVNELLAVGSDAKHLVKTTALLPLLLATQEGHVEVISSLVAANASLNDSVPATRLLCIDAGLYILSGFGGHRAVVVPGCRYQLAFSNGRKRALMVAATGESSDLLQQASGWWCRYSKHSMKRAEPPSGTPLTRGATKTCPSCWITVQMPRSSGRTQTSTHSSRR